MRIECPGCHKIADADDSLIPESRQLQCLTCHTVFHVDSLSIISTPAQNFPPIKPGIQEGTVGYCPKCGFKQVLGMECINCGIVFFKYAAALEKEMAKRRPPVIRRLPPPPKSDIAELNSIDKILTVSLRLAVGLIIFFIGCIPYGAIISGGSEGFFSLLLLAGLLYLCWILPPKIIPPIKSGFKKKYIINLKEKLIIIIGIIIAFIMGIFPPFYYVNRTGASFFRGYYFIFSAPNYIQIDIPRLFVQWVITGLVTFVIYFLAKEIQKQKYQL